MRIYTIGHSTRNINDFIDILKHCNIQLVIDVRMFPSSSKFPHFNKENLEKVLPSNGVEYIHFPELGGFRKEGYKTFAQTEEFTVAVGKLLELIDIKTAAILCAEVAWFRCHRRHIAERLVEMGNEVVHIYDKNKTDMHKLHDEYIKEKMNLKVWCDKKAKKLTTKSGE